ncbi:MAG: phosphonate ABC transporter ATP-binding protein [Verrucomicrobiales bacterium]
MTAAFQLDGATCRFGDLAAVDGVSLSIEQGERVAFIGPSGSGKTTLLRLLNTMRSPDEGSVSVFGDDVSGQGVADLRRLRSKIATIPQHLGLVPNLTAIQNVVLGRGGRRSTLRSIRDLLMTSRSDSVAIHAILDRVGIEEKLYNRVSELSGGQQQRVAIARALFQQPEALLADEPVSSVDPARARDTVRLLTELSAEDGFTLCVSLHHIELAREFFPRLVGLRSGKVVFDDAPGALEESQLSELYDLNEEEMMKDA